MPVGTRKSSVRASNFPRGASYLEGEALYTNPQFPAFEFVATADSNTLSVVFPAFELASFDAASDGFVKDFPLFEVTLTALAGAVATIDKPFPSFEVAFGLQRSGEFAFDFPIFETDLTAVYGDLTATLGTAFPLWLFNGLIVGPTTSTDYQVWVVNPANQLHSTYTNWAATSFGVFNDVEIISMADGLYALTGDTDGDDQIDAKVYWPPSNFNTDKQQRIECVYARLRGSDLPIRIVATVDEVEKRVYTADMFGFPDGIHPKRVLFTRNLGGNMWQIGFENTQGGSFSLAEIEVITVPSPNRRLK